MANSVIAGWIQANKARGRTLGFETSLPAARAGPRFAIAVKADNDRARRAIRAITLALFRYGKLQNSTPVVIAITDVERSRRCTPGIAC